LPIEKQSIGLIIHNQYKPNHIILLVFVGTLMTEKLNNFNKSICYLYSVIKIQKTRGGLGDAPDCHSGKYAGVILLMICAH